MADKTANDRIAELRKGGVVKQKSEDSLRTRPRPRPIQGWKARRRMAFQDLLRRPSPRPADSPPPEDKPSIQPRATPPHLKNALAGADAKVFTSPPQAPNASYRYDRPITRFGNTASQQSSSSSDSSVSLNRRGNYGGGYGGRARPFSQQMPSTNRRTPFNNRSYITSSPASNPEELRIYVTRLPLNWTTLKVYNHFECLGSISRIEIQEQQALGRKNAVVIFRPAPKDMSWVGGPFEIIDGDGNKHIIETKDETRPAFKHFSPTTNQVLPELISVPLDGVDFGAMEAETKMAGMQSARSLNGPMKASLSMNLQHKELTLTFPAQVRLQKGPGKVELVECDFRMRFNPAQICNASTVMDKDDSSTYIFITAEDPPRVFRKTTNIDATHDSKATLWGDHQLWFRQTSIDMNPSSRKSPVTLREDGCIVDIGRWLTYRLKVSKEVLNSTSFENLRQALTDHNIPMKMEERIDFQPGDADNLWNWLDAARSEAPAETDGFLAELHELASNTVHVPMPFPTRYQLEVCLSLGVLHECNMTRSFMEKLTALDPARAVKVLEKVADDKKRYFNPEDIFRLQNRVSVVQKKRPDYCSKIPSAVVTPTTIYFATPVLETSNRVIRHFKRFEDRFLRVKFTDETHKGKLWPQDDRREDEVFSRISRTMTYGIQIGDRHYEFLAFGSSQFREHGAYFFSSTSTLTAADIRNWMGDFTDIKVVAKYCARLGQRFSTTRAIPHAVTVKPIDDVNRNGFCFTDGAGKISPFLARMIAHQFGLKNSEDEYPSMFQFRMGGYKGVLAVDPSLRGNNIEVRPSQQKFKAEFYGLDICRISQFSAAYLNTQIILVLSALGVPDQIFVSKLRDMLSELRVAMTDEQKALDLLQKNIDYNQMTIALAGMILDGFMETKDPFVISCLRLWRSWSLKYLKEKARIYVDQGAFVLAGPDETATLKGDYKTKIIPDETNTLKGSFTKSDAENERNVEEKIKHDDKTNKEDDLPEIFLQVPDPASKGKYKVIEGVCVFARNPSLHPGDIRMVRAVDVPALHHMRNVVILPVTGYQDLASMCSGGDLDGDDYIVIWDKDLFPKEWNHPPMDYTAPTPTKIEGDVILQQIIRFFVQHIKFDNLARIATAHRYWADQLDDGIKDPKCIELAHLHSKAVDYAKTGVPAEVPADLKVKRWPHWSEPKNKSKSKIYKSEKILGKLYDEVKREPFNIAWDLPFDERILSACDPSDQMLKDAKEVKASYDEAMRRIMAQYGIGTEFEVFMTFVLEHHQDNNDYKLAETIGEVADTLKQQHQEVCYEKAGTDAKTRDWAKMKSFLVAMYKVTADEINEAYKDTKQMTTVGGRQVPIRALKPSTMPFMSFPWIFARELGQIATRGAQNTKLEAMPRPSVPKSKANATKQIFDLLGDDYAPAPLPEINTSAGTVREGDLLDLFHDDSAPATASTSDVDPVTSTAAMPAAAAVAEASPPATVSEKVTSSGTTYPPSPVAMENMSIPKKTPEEEREAWPSDVQQEHLMQSEAARMESHNEIMRKVRLYQQAGLPSDSFDFQAIDEGISGLDLEAGDESKVEARKDEVKGEETLQAQDEAEDGDDEWEGEDVTIEFDEGPSRLDRLAALVGTG